MQRLKHAFHREDWLRDVRGRTYFERIDNMVQLWGTLGVVEPVAAPQERAELLWHTIAMLGIDRLSLFPELASVAPHVIAKYR